MASKEPFLLETFWPLLKLAQLVGCFPCKKVVCKESGKVNLVPISLWIWLPHFTFVLLLAYGNLAASFAYVVTFTNHSLPLLDYLPLSLQGLAENYTDGLALFFTLMVFVGLQIDVIARNYHFSHDLTQMQDYFAAFMRSAGSPGKKTSWLSAKKMLVFYAILFCIVNILTNTSYTLLISKNLDVAFPRCIWLLLSMLICTFLIWIPVFAFMAVFGDIVTSLIDWIVRLKEDLNIMDFDECLRLAQALTLATRSFSVQLFFIISADLAGLICVAFKILTFIIGSLTFDPLFIIGYVGFAAILIDFLHFFNYLSQNLVDEMEELRLKLVNLCIPNDNMVLIEGNPVKAKHGRRQILENFSSFKGFEAMGFFQLGSPLLTSISANFLTYLIILVQFGTSEKGMPTTCSFSNELRTEV